MKRVHFLLGALLLISINSFAQKKNTKECKGIYLDVVGITPKETDDVFNLPEPNFPLVLILEDKHLHIHEKDECNITETSSYTEYIDKNGLFAYKSKNENIDILIESDDTFDDVFYITLKFLNRKSVYTMMVEYMYTK